MAKVTKILLFFVIAWFILGTVDFFFNVSGRLGHGYYIETTSARTLIKHKNIEQLWLSDVLLWRHDDTYIALVRNKERFFDCKNGSPVFREGLRYVLINKTNNHIFETDTYIKFRQRLRTEDIKLSFSDEDIKHIRSKLIHEEPDSRTRLDKLRKQCKENYVYPIENF